MSLDGQHDVSPLPSNSCPAGVDLGSAIALPPGGQVFYVRGNGTTTTGYSFDPPGLPDRLIASVAKALTYCVANRGDTIVVLPGHTENIATANAWPLVANVRILGVGTGNARPTFTWTTAASTVLMNVAGVSIENCVLLMEPGAGTVTVAAPITVSAAGCAIANCRIRAGTDANNKVTIGVTTTAGANQFLFTRNRVRGAAAATMTTFLRLVGLADCEVSYNDISCGTTAAAVGPIQALTTAPTDVYIHHNSVNNNAASSTACITGMAAMTGTISDNRCRNQTDASVAWIPTPGNTQLFENYGVNNNGETGILIGTPSV